MYNVLLIMESKPQWRLYSPNVKYPNLSELLKTILV